MAAMLATNFDPATGRMLGEKCLSLSRAIGFDEGMAWSLMWIGYIDARKRDPSTAELFDESMRVGRRIEDPWRRAFLLGQCLICYAGYEALMGREESAEAMALECETQIAKIGNDLLYRGHCRALSGTMATRRGELDRAGRLLAESLVLYRAVDSKFDIAGSLAHQGFLALRQQDPARALQLFKESLPLHRNYPMSPWVTKGLAHLLIAYAACERWHVAAQLAGVLSSADGTVGESPAELSGRVAREYEESVARTRGQLGDAAFDDEIDAGRRMTREQAIEFALADLTASDRTRTDEENAPALSANGPVRALFSARLTQTLQPCDDRIHSRVVRGCRFQPARHEQSTFQRSNDSHAHLLRRGVMQARLAQRPSRGTTPTCKGRADGLLYCGALVVTLDSRGRHRAPGLPSRLLRCVTKEGRDPARDLGRRPLGFAGFQDRGLGRCRSLADRFDDKLVLAPGEVVIDRAARRVGSRHDIEQAHGADAAPLHQRLRGVDHPRACIGFFRHVAYRTLTMQVSIVRL